MMPLSRQEEFFVPEFSEEEVSIATTELSSASHLIPGNKISSSSSRQAQFKDEQGFVKPKEPKTKKDRLIYRH